MLGERLKALRIGMNQTQQQIADHLGITRAAYSHLKTIETSLMVKRS